LIATTSGSIVPVPVRMPPAFTATFDVPVSMPSTSSVPPLTVVAPV
jgi:hypothetical protein